MRGQDWKRKEASLLSGLRHSLDYVPGGQAFNLRAVQVETVTCPG